MTPDPDSRLRADVTELREAVARAVNPIWFGEHAEALNNYDGQHLTYQASAREAADRVFSALGSPSDVLAALRSGEMVAVPKQSLQRVSDELGIAVHTALRRVGDSQWSTKAWQAIRDMPPEEWGSIMDYARSCLDLPFLLTAPSAARKEDGRE